MDVELKKEFQKKIVPIEFERRIGLFGATTLGIGALMGAGIYVLIGLAAQEAGTSVWLAFLLCGATTYLTTLLYIEITKLQPGGGYTFAFNTLGSFGGFIIRWFPALASVFASGLYAMSFAEYLVPVIGFPLPPIVVKLMAVAVVMGITWVNVRSANSSGKVQTIFIWGNLGILLILSVGAVFVADTKALFPVMEKGPEGMLSAISIIYISFFGFQLIGANTDEIKNPARNVPLAMKLSMGISLVFYLMVAAISVMVVSWQVLAGSNAPLTLVATEAFGQAGFVLVTLGSVMASVGALNTTILSQGRQIYSLGKKNFLPAQLGTLNRLYKTPEAALYAGSGLVVISLLFFDLIFIAKSANFCLLVSLLPVSLALRKVYRDNPTKRPKTWWKKILPELAFVSNIGLLMTLDWVSLVFGAQLVLIGLAVYFFYGWKHERMSNVGLNIALAKSKRRLFAKGKRILVPLSNPLTQAAILRVSGSLIRANGRGGLVNLLKVVFIPQKIDLYDGLKQVNLQELDVLVDGISTPGFEDLDIRPVVRASHHLAKGIVHAAEEENCDLIVMGYSSEAGERRNSLMAKVVHYTKTDTIMLRLRELDQDRDFSPQKIAVMVGGGANLPLMLRLAGALADQFDGRITFLHILPENYDRQQRQASIKTLVDTLESQHFYALFDIKVLSSAHVLETIVDHSAAYDLLITGTTTTGLMQRAILGNFATQLAERAACSVAVVRKVPSAKKFINQFR